MAQTAHDAGRLFDVLGDPDCRAILRALASPLTAREVASQCDLPLSTAYRKLETLAETPLVEQSHRVRERGKHPRQYERRAHFLLVRLPDEEVEVVTTE
jgi:DNA-binding transcriptional ArsR family regulator